MSMTAKPVTTFAHYRVRPGREEELLELLGRHWPLLRRLELVTEEPGQVFVGHEPETGGPLVIEVFEWVGEEAVQVAHTHPEVTGLWEAMGPLCEERGGRPRFEFPVLRRVALT
jgi:hypothetical protein